MFGQAASRSEDNAEGESDRGSGSMLSEGIASVPGSENAQADGSQQLQTGDAGQGSGTQSQKSGKVEKLKKEIESIREKMYQRSKGSRVSAGALNRDIQNMQTVLDGKRKQLKELEQGEGDGIRVQDQGGTGQGEIGVHGDEQPGAVDGGSAGEVLGVQDGGTQGKAEDGVHQAEGSGQAETQGQEAQGEAYSVSHAEAALESMWKPGYTPEQHKAAYKQFLENKEGVRSGLMKMTVEQLKKEYPGFYRSNRKADIVDDAMSQIQQSFNFKGTISYNPMVKGAMDAAMQRQVDSVTPEIIAEKQAERSKKIEEHKARVAEHIKSIQNPETDEQIIAHVEKYKPAKVKPEILKRYDEIKAKQAFEKFSSDQRQAYEQRQTVKPVAGDSGQATIHDTKHTKTGEPLTVVRLGSRVDRDEYKEHLANAKRLGGRQWLEDNDAEHEKLPEGTFKGEHAFRETGVNTRMVTIHKR